MVARWRFLQKVVPFLGGHSWSFCRFWSTHLRWSWKRRMIREGHGEHRPQKFWRKYSKKKSGKQWVLVRGLLLWIQQQQQQQLGTCLCVSTIFLPMSTDFPIFLRQIRGFRAWWSGWKDRHPSDLKVYGSQGMNLSQKNQKKKQESLKTSNFIGKTCQNGPTKKSSPKCWNWWRNIIFQPIDSMILLLRSP